MLFTRNLITQLIPNFKNITDQEFINAINSLGMEIETIHKYFIPSNCVIGKILKISKIQNTHLNYCDVLVDDDKILKIICGANNLKENVKVIVAKSGAKLPNGIEISRKNIHGFESNGMICAYFELIGSKNYISDIDKNGVILLDDGKIGSTDWIKILGLDDTIYDITVPANRNDENSYLVFCYELANKLNLSLSIDINKIDKQLPNVTNNINVDPTICSFLSYICYDMNKKLKNQSPLYLKSILVNHQIKPINYLFDYLNYITLLTNCPFHVYDANKLNGKIRCAKLQSKTKFIALDNKTYILDKNEVVIQDESKIISLPCIIGGNDTKWTQQTNKILIEIGNFNYVNIRNSSIKLNINTDAYKRSFKPLSNYLQLISFKLVVKQFGKSTNIKLYLKPNFANKQIKLSYEDVKWFFKENLPKTYIKKSLAKLGFVAKKDNIFIVPKWRLDIERQEDLFEEVTKVLDINKLSPTPIIDDLLPIEKNIEWNLKQKIKEIFLNNYFSEIKTYNLINKGKLSLFNLFNHKNPIKIQCNNLNRQYFRISLIDNMLKVYQYNNSHKLNLIPIFEIQNIFTNGTKNTNLTCLSLEKYSIDNISKSLINININFYKSIMEQIGKIFGKNLSFDVAKKDEFYDNESISIISNKKIIGYIGKIKNYFLKKYDLDNKQIYCLSINIDDLVNNYCKPILRIKPISEFQQMWKDINITLSYNKSGNIKQLINKISQIINISKVEIVDIFKKENMMIYTIRYYLIDTKQFSSNDLDNIATKIKSLLCI